LSQDQPLDLIEAYVRESPASSPFLENCCFLGWNSLLACFCSSGNTGCTTSLHQAEEIILPL